MRPDAPPVAPEVAPKWNEGATDRVVLRITPSHRHGYYVYIAWSRSGKRPLYVGKSTGFIPRIATHLRQAKWADRVVRFELYAFPTNEAAARAEILAIQQLDPTHNVVRVMTPDQIAETKAAWARIQAEKQAALAQRKQERAERHAQWLERKAAWHSKPKREARSTQPRPQSPWPRRRLRKGADVFDIASPEQMAIIRRVQNRGKAA